MFTWIQILLLLILMQQNISNLNSFCGMSDFTHICFLQWFMFPLYRFWVYTLRCGSWACKWWPWIFFEAVQLWGIYLHPACWFWLVKGTLNILVSSPESHKKLEISFIFVCPAQIHCSVNSMWRLECCDSDTMFNCLRQH